MALSYLAFVAVALCGIVGHASITAQTNANVCGTVASAFDNNPCQQISFAGEISSGQSFTRRFGKHLIFLLDPKVARGGWIIKVVPDQNTEASEQGYVWVVTPPYRSSNPTYLDTSYGISAKEAVTEAPRDFNFVLDLPQYESAADLVEKAIMSHPLTDKRSKEELEKEAQDAADALFQFPVAKGRLSILNSRIKLRESRPSENLIEWLKFRVDLRVPCSLVSVTDSPGMTIDYSQCPRTGRSEEN